MEATMTKEEIRRQKISEALKKAWERRKTVKPGRKKRAKGAWSKKARERHAVRMQGYWKARREADNPVELKPTAVKMEKSGGLRSRLLAVVVELTEIINTI